MLPSAMRSRVAEQVRREQLEEIRRLTPSERMELALRLGERDLQVYVDVQKTDRAAALTAIRRSRQAGRRYSRCMAELQP